MRLLVINWQDRLNPNAGGAEVHLHEVFGRLAEHGHEITFLVSGWNGAPARASVDGMDVHRVGSRHTFPAVAPPYYRRVLQARNFDFVVEGLNKIPLWTPLWAGHPVVLLVHHLFGATAFSTAPLPIAAVTWLAERPLHLVYRSVPVQAISPSTAQDLVERGFHPEQITVIHLGVDTAFYHPDARDPRTPDPTLLYLGRLQRYKRVDLIVRAIAAMSRSGVTLRLRVAGRGPEEASLRQLADHLGVADQIEFLGFVDEEQKRHLLRTSWVHVLTSPKEGWGLTVMEAAACGTPTVGSSSPGLRDSVLHGETGLLVQHGDWLELGRQLAELVQNRERLERMGAAARRHAEAFSWERSAAEAERHFAALRGASADP